MCADSLSKGFPGGSDGRESACSVGDPGSVPGSGRAPGGGNGNPLQYSCLESSTDRGAWWAAAHGVAEHRTRATNTATATSFSRTQEFGSTWAYGVWQKEWTAIQPAGLSRPPSLHDCLGFLEQLRLGPREAACEPYSCDTWTPPESTGGENRHWGRTLCLVGPFFPRPMLQHDIEI